MEGAKPAPSIPCRLSSSLNSTQGIPGLLIALLSTEVISVEVRSSLEMYSIDFPEKFKFDKASAATSAISLVWVRTNFSSCMLKFEPMMFACLINGIIEKRL